MIKSGPFFEENLEDHIYRAGIFRDAVMDLPSRAKVERIGTDGALAQWIKKHVWLQSRRSR